MDYKKGGAGSKAEKSEAGSESSEESARGPARVHRAELWSARGIETAAEPKRNQLVTPEEDSSN